MTSIFRPEATKELPLPLYSANVPAGFPSPADNSLDKTLDLNEFLVTHPAATFFVRVSGDSMRGAGIFPGDLLIVDRSLEAVHNKIVVAIVEGEFTVKRLLVQGEEISLAPENPAYPILHLQKQTDFQIWGVVTWVIHKAV